MHKILKIVLIVVGLIGAALWFMLPDRDMPAAEAAQSGAMGAMFIITYLLLGAAIVFSLVFTVKNLLSNPQGVKKALFVLGGLILIVIISYVTATGTGVDDKAMAMSDESTIKKIGMGINMFYILTTIAVGALVVPAVKKMFSK